MKKKPVEKKQTKKDSKLKLPKLTKSESLLDDINDGVTGLLDSVGQLLFEQRKANKLLEELAGYRRAEHMQLVEPQIDESDDLDPHGDPSDLEGEKE